MTRWLKCFIALIYISRSTLADMTYSSNTPDKQGIWRLKLNWEGLLPITGKVIVIEDDPTLRMLMTDILMEIGAQSLAFESADDALTYLLEAHVPCPLVVVDHALPGQIQGAEFIAMVKSKWPSTGAILMSGYLLESATIPPCDNVPTEAMVTG